jgi:hypothetical protein
MGTFLQTVLCVIGVSCLIVLYVLFQEIIEYPFRRKWIKRNVAELDLNTVQYEYLKCFEVSEGYARQNPNNCPVRERTADGVSVGPCCFFLQDGVQCPRHGVIRVRKG